MTLRADGSFKNAEDLRTLYRQAGVTGDKPVTTYCTVGGRASQARFVLARLLGFDDVRVCDCSGAGWGRTPDTAIAVGDEGDHSARPNGLKELARGGH